MSTEYTTPKGFKIIDLKIDDILYIGGLGICDSCNKPSSDFKYIGVLNSAYCPECFERWHKDAKFYREDVAYEERHIMDILLRTNL